MATEPVGRTSTFFLAASPSRMMAPSPNCLLMAEMASSRVFLASSPEGAVLFVTCLAIIRSDKKIHRVGASAACAPGPHSYQRKESTLKGFGIKKKREKMFTLIKSSTRHWKHPTGLVIARLCGVGLGLYLLFYAPYMKAFLVRSAGPR